MNLEQAAHDFLAQKRFAVVGVSRKGDTAANAVYKKLRDSGRTVFAVNPNATLVEGDPCHPNLAAISGGVDAVIIATTEAVMPEVLAECSLLGIENVWIHGTFGGRNVSDELIATARSSGIRLIPGSCPMMFCDPVDPAHRCIRWFRHVTGREARPTA